MGIDLLDVPTVKRVLLTVLADMKAPDRPREGGNGWGYLSCSLLADLAVLHPAFVALYDAGALFPDCWRQAASGLTRQGKGQALWLDRERKAQEGFWTPFSGLMTRFRLYRVETLWLAEECLYCLAAWSRESSAWSIGKQWGHLAVKPPGRLPVTMARYGRGDRGRRKPEIDRFTAAEPGRTLAIRGKNAPAWLDLHDIPVLATYDEFPSPDQMPGMNRHRTRGGRGGHGTVAGARWWLLRHVWGKSLMGIAGWEGEISGAEPSVSTLSEAITSIDRLLKSAHRIDPRIQ